jgi:hypothetical protein
MIKQFNNPVYGWAMSKKTTILFSSLVILSLLFAWSCSMRDVTDLRINGLTLLAVDENNAPIAGAIVQTSDDQNVTTGPDGRAALRFPAYGAFEVTVTATDRAPARLSVTMPSDRNETVTAHLGKPGTGGDVSINVNIGGLTAGISRMMTQMYPIIFQSLFSAHGYSIDLADYKPGEWTEWKFSDNQDFNGTMRKAYLKQLDNGQQWWQVVYTPEDAADKITMEVLFAKDKSSIRRMRQQSGNEAPAEVPVSEGWYTAPTKLTRESLEGAVVKRNEKVRVPAGTYFADILQFGQMGMGGTLSIWRSTKVPGGVVKTQVDDPDGSQMTSELKALGTGAKTQLGSY